MKLQYCFYITLSCFLGSCASYNGAMDSYYDDVKAKQYDAAQKKLEKNKLLKQHRNRLMYCMEAGKLYHLKKDYIKSNQYLNEADNIAENLRQSAGNVAAGMLINPMHRSYTGEDFEKHMLHYYKALNYAAMGLYEDAAVEARRINLTTQAQADKFVGKERRYAKDAFALNLQGMLFEMNGEINNAFISYRNAADIYLDAAGPYYGVEIPGQLKQDLLRTARQLGFTSDLEFYKRKFSCDLQSPDYSSGSLVLFLEEGTAPVKIQKNYWVNKAPGNRFYYYSSDGDRSFFDFDYGRHGYDESHISSLNSIKIAMPAYRLQSSSCRVLQVEVNGASYTPALVQNINVVAMQSLKERFVYELGTALARQLSKKVTAKGFGALATVIAAGTNKHKTDSTKTPEENAASKKEAKEEARMVGKTVTSIAGLFNRMTEKADTRNWQSLPAFINYVRIPLAPGENKIRINVAGKFKEISVQNTGGMQILSESSTF